MPKKKPQHTKTNIETNLKKGQSIISRLNTRAQEIRKDNPEMKWKECRSQATKEYHNSKMKNLN